MSTNSFCSKVQRRITLLIKSVKVWRLPPQQDLLILDRAGSKLLEICVLGHSNYGIIDVRGESINVPVLIVSLLTNRSYIYWYLRLSRAKYVLTYIDTNLIHLSELTVDVRSFVIQNGNRDSTFLDFSIRPKINYYFMQSEHFRSVARQTFEASNLLASGSIINNSFGEVNWGRIIKVQWISQFRHVQEIQLGRRTFSFSQFMGDVENLVFQILSQFCKSNNLSLEIITARSGDVQKENDYYQKISKIPFEIIENKESEYSFNSYKNLSRNAIIVGVDSTLLYEAFGRGFRVAFLALRNHFINDVSYRFAWPLETSDIGPFWCNIPDEQAIYGILENLFQISQKEWQEYRENFAKISFHDFGNQLIKQVLHQEGVEIVELV